jgi:hypothetical protein
LRDHFSTDIATPRQRGACAAVGAAGPQSALQAGANASVAGLAAAQAKRQADAIGADRRQRVQRLRIERAG